MKTMYAGPAVMEFGWILFCWSGWLRKRAKSFDRCVVACEAGTEVLYQDFADEIVKVVNLPTEGRFCYRCDNYKTPEFQDIFGHSLKRADVWYPPNRHTIIYPRANWRSSQEFVRLGRKTDQKYDLLLHARDRRLAPERNWQADNWLTLIKLLQPQSVASVGTSAEASHIDGTDDLRDMPLGDLVNVMRSSNLLIGPSSGAIHLAALCDLPTVTWYGLPYKTDNQRRFETDWNPFGAKVRAIYWEDWQPTAFEISSLAQEILRE